MNLTLQTIPSTVISEIFCLQKFDGIVLDTEHGCFNNESLYSCIQVVTGMNKKCFVRITDFNKQLIRMCLDAGVTGLIFSTIEDEEIGDRIIKYCNYPSKNGKRGMGLVRQNSWGQKNLDEYEPILMAQIETKRGIQNLNTIKKCKFDYFVLGPYDLSSDLDCPGDWENEKYCLHVKMMCDILPREKLGIFIPTIKQIEKSHNVRDHFSMIVMGMDTDFLKSGMEKIDYEVFS